MNENDILRAKYKAKGFGGIAEFVKTTNSRTTEESWGKVLNRDKKVSTELFLRMAGELGCTPEEIRDIMLARGEAVIAGLIAPAAMSSDDRKFLAKLHALGGDQKKLKTISDMLDLLKG